MLLGDHWCLGSPAKSRVVALLLGRVRSCHQQTPPWSKVSREKSRSPTAALSLPEDPKCPFSSHVTCQFSSCRVLWKQVWGVGGASSPTGCHTDGAGVHLKGQRCLGPLSPPSKSRPWLSQQISLFQIRPRVFLSISKADNISAGLNTDSFQLEPGWLRFCKMEPGKLFKGS